MILCLIRVFQFNYFFIVFNYEFNSFINSWLIFFSFNCDKNKTVIHAISGGMIDHKSKMNQNI